MKYDLLQADRLGIYVTRRFLTPFFHMTGSIHSIETMGLVDGPGIRFVVFMQGCALRCIYCHNPDTWEGAPAMELTPDEVLKRTLRFKSYFGEEGGITFSGGEPLLQSEFLAETLRLCKENGIHTCIDTAGVGKGQYRDILKYTDLVLYDIKHFNAADYKKITKSELKETLVFLNECMALQKDIWIRHVIVPGINDSDEHIKALAEYIKTISGVKNIQLMPYHRLGVEKYKKLGIRYLLEDTPAMNETVTKRFEDYLRRELCL